VSVLSLAELQQVKHELKQERILYDMNFYDQHGRMPENHEKEPIRHLYERYSAVKGQIELIEKEPASIRQQQKNAISLLPATGTAVVAPATARNSMSSSAANAAVATSVLRERTTPHPRQQSREEQLIIGSALAASSRGPTQGSQALTQDESLQQNGVVEDTGIHLLPPQCKGSNYSRNPLWGPAPISSSNRRATDSNRSPDYMIDALKDLVELDENLIRNAIQTIENTRACILKKVDRLRVKMRT
jgi:hypothetical protein